MPDRDPARPTALFVSPHLDDVAFSCGGLVASLARRGWRVVVATVFTRSVPNPTGFALACVLDKGLRGDVDYLALRRLEDFDFGRLVGAEVIWFDLPEAPHRGYTSAPDLFAGVHPDDRADREVADRLTDPLVDHNPAWVFAPQGVGNHVDHLQVIRALLGPYKPWPIARLHRVAWYRDLPYAAKFPEARPAPELTDLGLVEVAAPLTESDLGAKVAGSRAYATQVPFQFGSPEVVGSVLGGFAEREGKRLGIDGPAESFLIDPKHRDAWATLID